MTDYSIVKADDVEDAYADSDVPGEFRSLTDALGSEQVALTLIRIPPHSDFEQGSGHRHVQVAPRTLRSHRNEGDEPVELWAISPVNEGDGGEKVDDFWEASPEAAQHR